MKTYKKTYKGFIVWLILFLLLVLICPIYIGSSEDSSTLLLFDGMNVSILALVFIIYKTESIYWYTGISYEEASQLSELERKAYAKQTMMCFVPYHMIYFVYSFIGHILDLPWFVSLVIGLLCICVPVFKSMKYKLPTSL